MRNYILSHLLKVSLAFILVFTSAGVKSVELRASLFSKSKYSNNINQTHIEQEKIDEVIETITLDTALEERRKKFTASITASLQHERYLNETYSNQSELATGVGLVNFQVIESFLDWKSSYRRVRILKDEDLPDVPTNIAMRDTYTSGPRISYAINNLTNLSISSTYNQTEISDPDAQDTKRIDTTAGISRLIGSLSSIGLTVGFVNLLDADGGDEYERSNWVFNFDRKIVRGSLSTSVGAGEFKSQNGNSTRTTFYDFSVDREAFLHNVGLTFRRNTTDTSVGSEYGDTGNLPDADLDVNDIYEEDTLRISLNRDLNEFLYNIDAYHIDRKYMVVDRNDIRSGFSTNLGYKLRDGLTMNLAWIKALSKDTTKPLDGLTERNTYRISGKYDFSKELSIDLSLQYFEKQNTRNEFLDNEEFSLGMNLRWIIL